MIAAESWLAAAPVLVVDDEPVNVRLLERLLASWGHGNVRSTTDSSQVMSLVEESRPSLILLDLLMPAPDGFEVMRLLSEVYGRRRPIPVLVLTADMSPPIRDRALAEGASDFLTKPFDGTEARLRVQNLLRTQYLQLELEEHNELLEQRVAERTAALEQARRETLERLALAGEYRDDETYEHAQRVGRTAALLAAELGLGEEEVELMRRAAPLHDIGKLGISDSILLKPAKLTEDEFEVMKEHTVIGGRILGGSTSVVLQRGEIIATTHHERWDGGGYPAGLAGDAIPLPGRVVAVADVFDALTHERPYKEAWPQERAVAEIARVAGSQFDPRVVDGFARLEHAALLAPVDTGGVCCAAEP